MLLLFNTSCNKKNKEVVEVAFDKETTYTMKDTDITSLISDSGITRYKMIAKEVLMYAKATEPYWYFPKGVYVEKFDTLFNPVATIKADTAYYWNNKGLIKLISNVEVQNLEGENFQTSLLYWDEKADRVWSDEYIRIQRGEKIITGIGFESNRDMSNYRIFRSSGEFPISDTSPADSTRTHQDPVPETPNPAPLTP